MLYEIRHQEEAEIILLQLCFVSTPALSFADSVKQPTVKTSRHIHVWSDLTESPLTYTADL